MFPFRSIRYFKIEYFPMSFTSRNRTTEIEYSLLQYSMNSVDYDESIHKIETYFPNQSNLYEIISILRSIEKQNSIFSVISKCVERLKVKKDEHPLNMQASSALYF